MSDSDATATRRLAAILFSDVVGYSVLVGKDEASTLQWVARDFAVFTTITERHGGTVVKNTGDGLMITFNSGMDAVEAALEIQNELHEQNKLLPSSEQLQHRVGIHLGDVVEGKNDVVGDSVNIAARILSEARPNAICISQSVYDAVQGKLNFEITRLGPRTLKNIMQPIVVWQIPPRELVNISRVVTRKEPVEMELAPMVHSADRNRGFRGAMIMVVVAAMLVAVLYLLITQMRSALKPVKTTSNSTNHTPSKLGNPDKPVETPEPKDKPLETKVTPDDKKDPLAKYVNSDSKLKVTLPGYLAKYDFAGIVKFLLENGYDQTEVGNQLIAKYSDLALYRSWLAAQLDTANVQNPIYLPQCIENQDVRVLANNQKYTITVGTIDSVDQQFEQISPLLLNSLGVGIAKKGQRAQFVDRNSIIRWTELFAAEFGIEKPSW